MRSKMDERVVSIMTTPAITVRSEATLREVARALSDANIGAVVVLPDGGPMGVISERDIVRALADGADPDEVYGADVMSEEPRYVTPSLPVPNAAEEMLAAGIRHMPVVDDGEVVGMVGARDALAVVTRDALRRREGLAARSHVGPLEQELAHPGV